VAAWLFGSPARTKATGIGLGAGFGALGTFAALTSLGPAHAAALSILSVPAFGSIPSQLFEMLRADLPDFQTARLHPEAVTPFAHGAKTGNYWMQCDAQSAARVAGFDHALLPDDKGRLLSAAMGNVFFVRDGELRTPALSLAVRPGVMRSWVMAQESVREVEVAADSMESAQEIFLTNSRLGVMPLRFGKVEPGPVGCALRDRCRREKIIP
jgi:branched-subunit amino acid aminotransferase/4-amino-4-deoxychorismate lyase